jgi:hypothetical protein
MEVRKCVAQSVQQLDTGWTTEGLGIESREGQYFYFFHVIQTGTGFHQKPA